MQKIVASAILDAMTQTCRMLPLRRFAGALLWLALLAPGARADATWIEPGADGQPVVHLYFFWSLACPSSAR